MTMMELKQFLLWSLVINYGILMFWFLMLLLAHDWVYRLHTRWFMLSQATFDAIHYSGMAIYKIGIFLLNLAPWLALHLVL